MNVAKEIDGIPVVSSTTERGTLFPAPAINQRVHNLGSGNVERWNGVAWVTAFALTITPEAFGANGAGVTDNSSAIATAIAAANAGLTALEARAAYPILTPVAVDLATAVALLLHGSTLSTTADIVLLDLHPSANPASPAATTIFDAEVESGTLICTAASPASAIGLKVLAFRNFVASLRRIDGFKYGIYCAGQDTYEFRGTRMRNNTVGLYVPNWSEVIGGETQSLKLEDIHFTGNAKTVHGLIEGIVNNLKVVGGSCNGTTPGWLVDCKNSTKAGINHSYRDIHFESQLIGQACIKYTGGVGFSQLMLSIEGCDFGSQVCTAIDVDRINGLKIEKCSFSQFTAQGGVSIKIGANVTKATIDMSSCYFNDLTTIQYSCLRQNITFIPEWRPTDSPVDITGYNGNTFTGDGATNTTIDMSVAMTSKYPTEAPPKGYMVQMQVSDSASAAAPACWVELARATFTSTSRLHLDLAGAPNGSLQGIGGYVQADANGDIVIKMKSSGANTLTIYLKVVAIHM